MKINVFRMTILVYALLVTQAWCFSPPEGKITVRVLDEMGDLLAGMPTRVTFEIPHPRKRGIGFKKAKGFTDGRGRFSAQSNTLDSLSYSAEKIGYYKSWGEFNFAKSKSGKWQPWNPTVELVMRKIENPVPMYARKIGIDIPIVGKEVGFDLMAADWIEPYGKGRYPDFVFKIESMVKGWLEFEGTLTLTFSNKLDGIKLVKEDRYYGSEFKLPRFAPAEGYKMKWVKHNKSLPKQPYEEDYAKDNNYIFRARSEVGDGNLIRAVFGKIQGDIRFDPRSARIHFTYYLNPDYTRNLEYDPKRNLFINLRDAERVGLY